MCYRLYIINFSLSCKINTHQCFALSFRSSYSLDSFSCICLSSVAATMVPLIVVSTKASHFHSHRLIEFIFAQFPANTKMLLCKFATVFYRSTYSAGNIYFVALPMQNCKTLKSDKLHWQAANRCCYLKICIRFFFIPFVSPFLLSHWQTRIRASNFLSNCEMVVLSIWFQGEKSHSKLIFVPQSISKIHMIPIMGSLLNR